MSRSSYEWLLDDFTRDWLGLVVDTHPRQACGSVELDRIAELQGSRLTIIVSGNGTQLMSPVILAGDRSVLWRSIAPGKLRQNGCGAL